MPAAWQDDERRPFDHLGDLAGEFGRRDRVLGADQDQGRDLDPRQERARIRRPMMARCWRMKASGPVSRIIRSTTSSSAASARRSGWTRLSHSAAWTASKRPRSARAISRSRAWRRSSVSGRARRVEEREARHPARRLPQNLQGDIAPHRMPQEREPLRRLGQQAGRDGGDRAVPAVLRDQNRPLVLEGGDLGLEDPPGRVQPRNQDQRV